MFYLLRLLSWLIIIKIQQNATRLSKKHSSGLIECNILMNEEMEYVQPSKRAASFKKWVWVGLPMNYRERYEAIKEYKNTYIHTHTFSLAL